MDEAAERGVCKPKIAVSHADCLALLIEMAGCDHLYCHLLEEFANRCEIVYVYVPSHVGIWGNEIADRYSWAWARYQGRPNGKI